MTMKRWDGAAYVDLATVKRWDGSAWVDLTIAKRWDGSAWIDITLPGGGGGTFSATANRNPVTTLTVDDDESLATDVTSYPVTITATGGTAPYTYAWTKLSGASAIVCSSPTSATTDFIATIYRGVTKTAVYRCTVRDATSATKTVDITVTLSR